MSFRWPLPFLVGPLAAALLSLAAPAVRADEIQVAVAANFTAPMEKIAREFEKETGHRSLLSFGTVGKFYSQIKNGAAFEVLVSADAATPDRLVQDGLAVENTRFTYAIGKLVLWSDKSGKVDAQGAILKKGNFKHLALANPKLAVYGAAGEEVLRKLGVLDAVQPKIVTGENITQAYQFVATGNADLGFVALSQVIGADGKIDKGSAWIVPSDLYPPIKQDVILLGPGKGKEAALALVNFLRTEKARSIIRSYGYDLPAASAAAGKITIAAAADLKFAMDEVVSAFKKDRPRDQVDVVYGSSGKFHTQIQQGAPYDVYFSADVGYARSLFSEGLAVTKPVLYAIGRIVLWSPVRDATKLSLEDLTDESFHRIAIANPKHAPYGKRAEEALKAAGVWGKVEDKLIFGENIAQTAQYVETGNAEIGIIALSLAVNPQLAGKGGYALIPSELHEPLEQAYVITTQGAGKALAKDFAQFMTSPEAQRIMTRYGFVLPGETASR